MNRTAQIHTGSAPKPSFTTVGSNLLQRKCACGGAPGLDGMCAACREKRKRAFQRSLLTSNSQGHTLLPGGEFRETLERRAESGLGHTFGGLAVFPPGLTINEPGDRYELEADRVADMVMRMPGHEAAWDPTPPTLGGPKWNGEVPVQTKPVFGQASNVGSATVTSIEGMRGTGVPLRRRDRAFFESRLGYDFGRVRVHAGPQAAAAARSIRAHAFTLGGEIFFGSGRYAPDTDAGKRLLAHELTHVIQQRGSGPLRAHAGSGEAERKAPEKGIQQMAGQNVTSLDTGVCRLQRSPETCTFGEIRSWAITSVAPPDFTPPAGLADAKASIGAVCSQSNCHCVDGTGATEPGDQAAWRNIVAASGGTDRSGGGTHMCVGTEGCYFVHSCLGCEGVRRRQRRRANPLVPSGTVSVGNNTLYFYRVPYQGWCSEEEWRSGCRRAPARPRGAVRTSMDIGNLTGEEGPA